MDEDVGEVQMKKKAPWNLRTRLVSAIRKVWRTSPLRLEALRQACVDMNVKTYDRKYKCSECGGEFLLAQVDVDHLEAGRGENYQEMVDRLFCGVLTATTSDEGKTHVKLGDGSQKPLECVVGAFLRVLCKSCHAKKTKAEKKK